MNPTTTDMPRGKTAQEIMDCYLQQMAENHAIKIDTNFWSVIRELVEFQQMQSTPPHTASMRRCKV